MTTTHEPVFLRGWGAIEKATGMDQREMRALHRDHGFPVVYAGGRPVTTPELLREWLRDMVRTQDRTAQDSCEAASGDL